MIRTDDEAREAFFAHAACAREYHEWREGEYRERKAALKAANDAEGLTDLYEEDEGRDPGAPLALYDWERGNGMTFAPSDLKINPATGEMYADEIRQRGQERRAALMEQWRREFETGA